MAKILKLQQKSSTYAIEAFASTSSNSCLVEEEDSSSTCSIGCV